MWKQPSNMVSLREPMIRCRRSRIAHAASEYHSKLLDLHTLSDDGSVIPEVPFERSFLYVMQRCMDIDDGRRRIFTRYEDMFNMFHRVTEESLSVTRLLEIISRNLERIYILLRCLRKRGSTMLQTLYQNKRDENTVGLRDPDCVRRFAIALQSLMICYQMLSEASEIMIYIEYCLEEADMMVQHIVPDDPDDYAVGDLAPGMPEQDVIDMLETDQVEGG